MNQVGTPVLTVEIISPSSQRLDRETKFARYQDAGVGQYWIMDPGAVDPGSVGPGAVDGDGTETEPSVEVFDLGDDGEYRLQVRATGTETATITGPVPTTLTPADLIA